jgi:hypothetical protein
MRARICVAASGEWRLLRRSQPEGETISFRKILIFLNFFGQNGPRPGTSDDRKSVFSGSQRGE